MTARRTRVAARRKELRLLFVSWELAPLAQTGGLGDMASGLARALAARGHAVTCILPAHQDVLQHPMCPALAVAGSVGEMDVLTDAIGAIDGVECTTTSIILSTKFER